ncbi:ABC transporter ATP-binding protein [Anaerococcus sp. Marseille-Q5996]|uniref:ABC transporter ATP-binding protein n=1 Tax=Anaerococcus sp. Marseille-Q5996 TaxID=2972769 RepID=UPI0021C83601|nr:ABC transporter ATP-binding protein [Anaerococcus sp. Marseille-Q5996]
MIKYENVSLTYPGSGKAIDNINFEIEDGELFVIVGPSGSGKTTTLKLINRLLRETEGQIFFDGADINSFDLRELRLNIGYVLQGIALFPNMTVAENIAIIPEMKNMNKADIIKRTDELLNEVGLDPDIYRDRLPSDLSGGEKQRIGILRAIIANPKVLLMDEPFSALDPISRRDLQDLIIDLQKSYKITTVFVTHDMSEALRVADRICIMQDGKIVQIGKGKEIIENPANKFVSQFFENESEYINE